MRLTSGPLHKDEYAADDYATTRGVSSNCAGSSVKGW